MTTTSISAEREGAYSFHDVARLWWVFLVIGSAWIIFAITVFRFDWRSVASLSVLFGVFAIVAGVGEVFAAFGGEHSGWMTAGRLLLAAACLAIGVIAFVRPGGTFAALAAVMSFYFVITGIVDVAHSISMRHETAFWGLWFLLGLLQIGVGFWAAGDFGRRSILLVVWVGFAAIGRGISAFLFAFELRDQQFAPTPAPWLEEAGRP